MASQLCGKLATMEVICLQRLCFVVFLTEGYLYKKRQNSLAEDQTIARMSPSSHCFYCFITDFLELGKHDICRLFSNEARVKQRNE
jgi:hypothetical protein